MSNMDKPEMHNSLLGGIMPKKSDMIAYTINVSPHMIVLGKSWEDHLPDNQVRVLIGIHKRTMDKIKNLIAQQGLPSSSPPEELDNQVCFEFTKNGEVHSHGYFKIKETYTGYDRTLVTIRKVLEKESPILSISKYTIVVKWADDPCKWKMYIEKDLLKSGYKPYIHVPGQIMNKKTITDYIEASNRSIETEHETKHVTPIRTKALVPTVKKRAGRDPLPIDKDFTEKEI